MTPREALKILNALRASAYLTQQKRNPSFEPLFGEEEEVLGRVNYTNSISG